MTDIDLLLKALECKDEKRTGWQVRGIEDPESVAAHSWGVAFLAFLFADDAGVDRERAVEMAVLHDIHESVSGDIRSSELDSEQRAEKKEKEAEGLHHLLALADRNLTELQERWGEYEERETETARFVKDMDKLEAALQGYFYHRNERYRDEDTYFQNWNGVDEFFEGTAEQLNTDTARKLLSAIRERYEGET